MNRTSSTSEDTLPDFSRQNALSSDSILPKQNLEWLERYATDHPGFKLAARKIKKYLENRDPYVIDEKSQSNLNRATYHLYYYFVKNVPGFSNILRIDNCETSCEVDSRSDGYSMADSFAGGIQGSLRLDWEDFSKEGPGAQRIEDFRIVAQDLTTGARERSCYYCEVFWSYVCCSSAGPYHIDMSKKISRNRTL